MAKKLKPIFFDCPRRQKVVLPSGPTTIFYPGRPERNPIEDVRDVEFLRGQSELYEVLRVEEGKGKKKSVRWVRRPAEDVRSRRSITSQQLRPKKVKAPPAKPKKGKADPPPAAPPADPPPSDPPADPPTGEAPADPPPSGDEGTDDDSSAAAQPPAAPAEIPAEPPAKPAKPAKPPVVTKAKATGKPGKGK